MIKYTIILFVCIQLLSIKNVKNSIIHPSCLSDNLFCGKNNRCCSNFCNYSPYWNRKICAEFPRSDVKITHISEVTEKKPYVKCSALDYGCHWNNDCCSKNCKIKSFSRRGNCVN